MSGQNTASPRKCSLIGVRPAVERALPLEQGKPLDCQCIALLPLRLFVDLLTARQLRLQLLHIRAADKLGRVQHAPDIGINLIF